MGSGTSKGIKVAPACVGEINASKRDADVGTPKQERRPLKTPKFTNATDSRNPARPDRHSEGRDSDVSAEDDDVDAELDRVLADYKDREKVSKVTNSAKKSFIRSKTYGLCNFRRVHADDDFNSTPQLPTSPIGEEPRGPDSDSVDVNKKINGVFSHFRKYTPPCPNSQLSGLLTRGHCMEPVPGSEKESSFGNCHSPSLAMPAIQYDGSEEELMDTIEREFS
ncbi:uncharacterized protein ACJ7VT_004155 [Polymixia lowei]